MKDDRFGQGIAKSRILESLEREEEIIAEMGSGRDKSISELLSLRKSELFDFSLIQIEIRTRSISDHDQGAQ